ncbi:hypothetical protein SUGI_0487270 [Cryptomeria japonica]|uniref:uncharacterized protein LOC131051409 n=1 Tax=Cryptomeria japonica TaxID=3369 RepID=UPI002408EA90|nr:uncharacterized protein LOC131051409 [Cryptomeria japonica]GLJ25448.1 hypothetical protein SUGI_0487270 [Cryptomeria japonica]
MHALRLLNSTPKGNQEGKQFYPVLLLHIFFCFEEIVKMISKLKLQEIVQAEYSNVPTYVFAKDGSDCAPQFRASVSFCGLTFQSPGSSRTLREAENAAANVALDALFAKPDDEHMQTNGPAVPIQIQSGEIHSNLQKEANKEEMLQPPGSLPSTSESGITNMLPTSGQKEQTAQLPQIHPHSFPSSRVHFASPRGLSASDNSGRGTNKQNMGNICSISGNSRNEKNNEQENNITTGMLGKRQRPEDLQQPEERISISQFCPGNHKSQLYDFAMACGFHFPAYSSINVGLSHRPRFKATVNFDGQTFESPGFFDKLRQAERAASLEALNSFSERVSTLVESPIGKILLEIKAQKEGSPLPVYKTTISNVSCRPIFTSTVKFNGMEFEGKAANNKKKAENNAATVAWSALKELKGSTVSTLQVPRDKGKAPVCESNDHPLTQMINHLKEETIRAASNVSAHNLPKAKRLAFEDQVKKLTMEMERLQELITSISYGSCTFGKIPQGTDQSQVQQEKNVDNDSRWGIPDVGDLPTNGWVSCGNFDNRGQHPTGSQANPNINHSLAQPCTNRSREIAQNTDQARVQQENNVQNVVDNVSRWGMPDVGDLPFNGWGGSGNFENRGQQPTGFQANPNTNYPSARPCTNRSRGRQQFRGRHKGRSGGRFDGCSNWASPPTNDKQAPAFQWAVCSNQNGVQQERNAQNGALNVGSGWDVAGISDPTTTEWDGWGNPEDINQPQVGSQTTTWRDFSSAQGRPNLPSAQDRPSRSRSKPRFPSHSSGRRGRSFSSTKHTEWTPPTRNDKQFPRLELAISPVRANVQEENVQTEETDDDGVEWILPDSNDPPAVVTGGWNNFDDKDPPPTTGIVAPCA